jgi:molybdenum cofactor cytidylyltransferase
MASTETPGDIFAIVLAAGTASRFGATKQLAEFDGVPLVRRAMETANAVCPTRTVLVVGHEWRAVTACCGPVPGFIVYSEDYTAGIGNSLASAVKAIRHAANAVVVLLADQVLITAEHVQALCSTWSGADDEIVATAYAGAAGAPALFPRGCFDGLMALSGDNGGRYLLSDDRYRVRTIACEAAAIDVDTPADLTPTSRSARN